MANPPNKTGGTTPPRRKAASRKATPPATQPPKDGGEDQDAETSAPPSMPKKVAVTPKPRAAKRAAPNRVEAARRTVADTAPAKLVADTRERIGDRNFFAAVLGATAALGAAVAGIFLATRARSDAAGEAGKPNAGHGAHQADGTDSSASFEAGIADESTIPDTTP